MANTRPKEIRVKVRAANEVPVIALERMKRSFALRNAMRVFGWNLIV